MDTATIAREFGPLISSLAHQFYGRAEDARDAAQEAWVEVLTSLPDFRGESSLKTWVYRVAWRRILAHKTKEREGSLRHLRRQYAEHELVGPAGHGPEARFWAEETCRNCMTGVLQCLTPDQRLCFLFRHTAELSFEDIAAILDTTVANVRQLFSRARRTLARFLSSDCAYARPTNTCRYGMDRSLQATGLKETFVRLGSFGSLVEAYRVHPKAMPGRNEWEHHLSTGSLSQESSSPP